MRRAALIGHSISHSISPQIHNAAFKAEGLDCEYILLDITFEELPAVVSELRQTEWIGANITIPYKSDVIRWLDSSSNLASSIGAVNTIFKSSGALSGENTDVDGFLNDLTQHNVAVGNEKVVILGSGGAARSVAFAVSSMGAEVHIVSRNTVQAVALVNDLELALNTNPQSHPWDERGFTCAQEQSRLLVNATPVGTQSGSRCPWPLELELPENAFVYDLVYNPPITRLLSMADEQGLRWCSGLGMLIEQAALSFEIWTGTPPPKDIMRRAALQELEAVND